MQTEAFAPPERFTAVVTDLQQADAILGSYYGDVGSESRNLALLEAILQNISAARLPLLVGGDFNLEAQVLASWLQCRFPFLQVVEAGPTCVTNDHDKASTIDYFAVSKTLLPVLGGMRTEGTTIKAR